MIWEWYEAERGPRRYVHEGGSEQEIKVRMEPRDACTGGKGYGQLIGNLPVPFAR